MRGGTEVSLALVMSFARVTALGPTTSWHEVDVGSVTPEATGDAVPVTYNGQLLVYGGATLDSGQVNTNKIQRCPIGVWLLREGSQWERLDSPPVPSELSVGRYAALKGVYGDELFVYGGSGPLPEMFVFQDVWAFHLQDRSWRQVMAESDPGPRFRGVAGVWGNRMYIFGGQEAWQGGSSDADTWYLDLVSETWTQLEVAQPWPSSELLVSGTASNIVQLNGAPYFLHIGNFRAPVVTDQAGHLRLLSVLEPNVAGWESFWCGGGNDFFESSNYGHGHRSVLLSNAIHSSSAAILIVGLRGSDVPSAWILDVSREQCSFTLARDVSTTMPPRLWAAHVGATAQGIVVYGGSLEGVEGVGQDHMNQKTWGITVCADDDSGMTALASGAGHTISGCVDVESSCEHTSYGSTVQATCPATCGFCTAPCADDEAQMIALASGAGVMISGCADVQSFCEHASYGSAVQAACPATCGSCTAPVRG